MRPRWSSWTKATSSSAPPEAALRGFAALVIASFACACAPPSARGLPRDALDSAVGAAIGDPSTCVLLADRASGQVVYRYGDAFSCGRALPRCDRPGTLTAVDALRLAAAPGARLVSCPSSPDGSRTVGWAGGRVPNTKRNLDYSAVMEGERALPGHEIAARLAEAFANAGL
jgi:hypothetical protein